MQETVKTYQSLTGSCAPAEKKNVERRENEVAFSLLIAKKICNFFKSRDDRQMTEISVSGTEVFSDAKMTETPYE